MIAAIAFYLFSFVMIASAVMVVAARNPVHSVLFLILAFFNAAALFVLLGAEFLAMILVVVYVGAVAVLFLFVVMMLDIDFAELRQGFLQYLPLGGLIGVILLAELSMVVGSWVFGGSAAHRRARNRPRRHQHRGTGPHSLHGLYLLLPDGGDDPAGRHGRRHRADAAAPAGRAAPVDRPPGSAPARRGGGRSSISSRGRGRDMTIGLGNYLVVAAILFTIGVLGIFINRKNVIVILMSIELILLAVNINLVAFSAYLGNLTGQVFALFVLTVAAAEAAIGLAILVCYFRNRGTIAVEDINLMKG